ncbi:MAG: polysaccharide deacetylase family protein [Planctomycetes bacterium]|nr:polysaccharide deacetylase family protein [Planctomycetota bacterium]
MNAARLPTQTPLLTDRRPARLPADHPPVLVVVVDTEEEFDWSAPFDRNATAVEAMRDVGIGQALFDGFGIKPCYVIDYPVATQETGWKPLKEIQDDGRCEIGAHLHPWVSPPHVEDVNARNSYPGNLPAGVEEEKLRRLADAIEDRFERRPRTYKAGRYGFGPNTTSALELLGFENDCSPAAGFDLTGDGGPDWSRHSPDPAWFGTGGRLLSIPTTGGFVGSLAGLGPGLHGLAHRPPFLQARLPGILSRLGALERLMLSPEGYGTEHLNRLTKSLLARGSRVFSFSFHSPSLRPGCTSYVRTEADRQDFLAVCRQYFDHFLGELGGVSLTPAELRERLLPSRPESSA